MEEFVGERLIDFFSEAGDMDIDDVVEGRRPLRLLPYVLGQHFARHDLPVVAKEIFDNFKFLDGEGNGPPGAGDGMLDHIHFQVG